MTLDRHITFFHNPQSRAAGVRILLEELQADHELKLLNFKTGDTRKPEFLAINPMGKVPTIVHQGTVVTEQAAIYLYLAELYPEAGLNVPVGDPLRGAFLRWLVFYNASFEPALLDRALKREAPPPSTAGYGDFETMFDTLNRQLRTGPWMLGERYTAADVLWGTGLRWTTQWKLVPETPEIRAYLERFNARPAVQRARAADEQLMAQLG